MLPQGEKDMSVKAKVVLYDPFLKICAYCQNCLDGSGCSISKILHLFLIEREVYDDDVGSCDETD